MNQLTPKATIAARVVLGLVFLVFGLNGFLQFLPQPPLPPAAAPFVTGLASSGYFFPLLKGIEVLAGVALLSNRFVPLALAVLAPIVVNIAAFHIFLVPGLPMVVLLLSLELFLAWSYRASFAPMLRARATPESPAGVRLVASASTNADAKPQGAL
ncbi:MAG: DoxX family protein [Labilithrix sp.]|nr:DoxX family protein [Labilithrix sp.]MCW5815495.1 DoxX family protein [Labilithrix sp.]